MASIVLLPAVLALLGLPRIREHRESSAVAEPNGGAALEVTLPPSGQAKSSSAGFAVTVNSVDRGRGSRGEHISFKAPIDFATGAVPSSAAFNVASGDQLPLQLTHATLSDSLAVGDFNRDGKPDVAQTNVIAGSVSIFLGDGRSGFAPPKTHPVGLHPNFVIAGRLDLDEHLDLAVASFGSDNLAILRGDGDGNFLPAPPVPVPAPRSVAIGRFNDDDIPDLAVASSGPACVPQAPGCGVPGISPAGGWRSWPEMGTGPSA